MNRTALIIAMAMATVVAGCGANEPTAEGDACALGSAPSGSTAAEPVRVHIDGPSYGSIDELAAAADIVVLGDVAQCPEQTYEAHLAGNQLPAGESGLPMKVFDMNVERVVKGEAADVIEVRTVDFARVDINVDVRLDSDVQLLIFLTKSAQDSYDVVGLDQGIFEVAQDGRVRPRTGNVLTEGKLIDEIVSTLTN